MRHSLLSSHSIVLWQQIYFTVARTFKAREYLCLMEFREIENLVLWGFVHFSVVCMNIKTDEPFNICPCIISS